MEDAGQPRKQLPHFGSKLSDGRIALHLEVVVFDLKAARRAGASQRWVM